jgi:hypothetical protein
MPNVFVDVGVPTVDVHDCKLDLVTIQGNLTGDQYIRDVLQPVVAPHFDNHPLTTRPVYIPDAMFFQLTNILHRRFPSLYTTA